VSPAVSAEHFYVEKTQQPHVALTSSPMDRRSPAWICRNLCHWPLRVRGHTQSL